MSHHARGERIEDRISAQYEADKAALEAAFRRILTADKWQEATKTSRRRFSRALDILIPPQRPDARLRKISLDEAGALSEEDSR